jgi:hypothetical protein
MEQPIGDIALKPDSKILKDNRQHRDAPTAFIAAHG